MKFTIETDSPAEAAALIEHITMRAGGAPSSPPPSQAAAPRAAVPSTPPPSAPVSPSIPTAGAMPAAAAPIAAPSPSSPPISAAPATQLTPKQVLEKMQEWKNSGHGVEGVKRVLAVINISKIPDATPEQLTWLHGVFTNQIQA